MGSLWFAAIRVAALHEKTGQNENLISWHLGFPCLGLHRPFHFHQIIQTISALSSVRGNPSLQKLPILTACFNLDQQLFYHEHNKVHRGWFHGQGTSIIPGRTIGNVASRRYTSVPCIYANFILKPEQLLHKV
jgi:hypothetical protein